MPAAVPTFPEGRSASGLASLRCRIPLPPVASAFVAAIAVGVNSRIQATAWRSGLLATFRHDDDWTER